MKTAIITGMSGQDSFYLARHLSHQGYRIIGTTRHKKNHEFNKDLLTSPQISVVEWNLIDQEPIEQIIQEHQPDEIYNFAALSSGATMFENPVLMMQINGLAVTKILDIIRQHSPGTKLCQASSSEIFGSTPFSPQNEASFCLPSSPYGASKLYADQMVRIYREKYGLYACSAILYNHESVKRPFNFVTRKITNTAAKIKLGLAEHLALGNLDSVRDWSFAGDVVRAMWLMLQQKVSSDYVVASGNANSVRHFCEVAFSYLDLDYRQYVSEDPRFYRPLEPVARIGNAQKIMGIGWSPQWTFTQLVHSMVDEDIKILSQTL